MVLGGTREILGPQLVLDREDEAPARRQTRSHLLKEALVLFGTRISPPGVLEYPHHDDQVVVRRPRDIFDLADEDLNTSEIPTPLPSDARPTQYGLYGVDLYPLLTQISRQCPASCPNLENSSTRGDGQDAKHVGAAGV